jgi:hypothetical protein
VLVTSRRESRSGTPSSDHEEVRLRVLFDMHSEGVGRHWIKISHALSKKGSYIWVGTCD